MVLLIIGFGSLGLMLYAAIWLYSIKKENEEIQQLFG
jgi:hypothetical protein